MVLGVCVCVCVSEGLLKVCVWQIQDSGFLESGVPPWLVEDPLSFVSFTGRSLVHNVLWMGPTYKYWSRLFWGVLSKKYCAMITEKNTLMILFIIALSSNVGPVWILWIILPLSTICGQKLRPICSVAKFDSPEPILCRVYRRRRNFEKSATDNNRHQNTSHGQTDRYKTNKNLADKFHWKGRQVDHQREALCAMRLWKKISQRLSSCSVKFVPKMPHSCQEVVSVLQKLKKKFLNIAIHHL